MKAGVVMNIVCLLVLQLATNTWAYAYFELGDFPCWAGDCKEPSNSTDTTQTVLRES